jgi:3-dehydroquinate dehydratase/shikimate dehydrogenase
MLARLALLCVPILVEDPERALALAREARDHGAGIVEFRLDTYYTADADEQQLPALLRLLAECPLPCIVTCRPVLEGGHYGGPEGARIEMLVRLGRARGPGERAPTYIDCELATYTRSEGARARMNEALQDGTGLILSVHNFQTRPPDLIRQIEAMLREPAARVAKVAYFARSVRDNLELLDLAGELRREHARPGVMLGMGPHGLMSRVLAPKFGAFLTFAALRRDEQTAPGQPVLRELVGLYRYASIGEATRVLGVIGWPIEHSLSPLVHNTGFEALVHDAVYLPLPVAPSYEAFKATLLDFIEHPQLDFAGCSVTLPHKEHLVQLAAEMADAGDPRWQVDRLSSACGAGNTLVVRRDARGAAARLSVLNTDGPAAVEALRARAGELGGRDVVVLGAGGTARAISAALLLEGARVALLNRTPDRADRLAGDLRDALGTDRPIHAITRDGLATLSPAAVINTTPLGMQGGPGPDQSPLSTAELASLPPACVVADCVYRPLITPLLQAAARAGLPTLDGVPMFVGQAAAQFEAWTGHPAPRQLFETTVRETLAEG